MPTLNNYQALEMNALVFCQDEDFLKIMNRSLNRLGLTTDVTADYDHALKLLAHKKFDAVVIDWQEVIDLGAFLDSVRNSKVNQDAVRVGIARDLRDIREAFSAGVQFLVHKPASSVQITRCFEAMQGAILRDRRRCHRENVRILVDVSGRDAVISGFTVINISNDGFGFLLNTRTGKETTQLTAGTEVGFAFKLPEAHQIIRGSGQVMWVNSDGRAGLQIKDTWEMDKPNLEQWVGQRFDQSVARLRQSAVKEAACNRETLLPTGTAGVVGRKTNGELLPSSLSLLEKVHIPYPYSNRRRVPLCRRVGFREKQLRPSAFRRP